jgi:hypothetical protein
MRRDLLATVLEVRMGVVAPHSLAPGPAATVLDKIAEMAAFVREGSRVCPDADQWHVYQALALPRMIALAISAEN